MSEVPDSSTPALLQWAFNLIAGGAAAVVTYVLGLVNRNKDRADNRMDKIDERIREVENDFVRREDLSVHLAPLRDGQIALIREISDTMRPKLHDISSQVQYLTGLVEAQAKAPDERRVTNLHRPGQ